MPTKNSSTQAAAGPDWGRCMIYGAYGYTGELTVRECVDRGITPVLAGRSEGKLAPLAERSGMPYRVVGLDDAAALDAALEDIDVVLHCAGPFSRTSKPMVDACLRTGTHYLDITGELAVFEACAQRDAEAKAAEVMVMPGTGFDVVPTDCMAAHLKQRLPEATSLELAFRGGAGMSHGTATTTVENLSKPTLVRRNGQLQEVRNGKLSRQVDFGRGPKETMAIPWGDVSTAWHSTGIPNITVYTQMTKGARRAVLASSYVSGLFATKPVQSFLKSRVKARPAGPSDEQRAGAKSHIWGRVEDAGGNAAEARLTIPEGYTLTVLASLEIAQRALSGDAPAGFQTPSSAYGADLVLEVSGSQFEDV